MKANPGGSIHPSSIVGRDHLITAIWKRLELQCVLLSAERRIGKTSVIRKMVDQPPSGWFGVYQDLEDIHSASEFATAVHDRIQEFLGRWKWVANAARKIYDDHDFGNLTKRTERPWKNLLIASIKDLIEAKPELRLVLFWDEVPYMIANIAKAEGEQTAAEVLDTLRKLRQLYPDELRMLFTGSIGLHHVLSQLHDAHIATEPVNDMYAIEVTPLARIDAIDLARRLIAGEALKTSQIDVAAETIASETDCFPFYVQHVVSSLSTGQCPAEPDEIRRLVQRQLVDANDPWELAHFRERIRIYYRDPLDARLVALLLDCLCLSELPRSLNELLKDINIQTKDFDDRDLLVRVLRLMERDHYLIRDTDGKYQFRFPLIRRWWKLDRGL